MGVNWGNIGQILYRILATDSDVTDIYGTAFYPLSFNTNTTTYPCIVYTVTNLKPTNTKGNKTQGLSKLDVYEIQLALFHETYDQMISGMETVRAALDYKQETSYTTGGQTVYLQASSTIDSRQDYMDEYGDNGLYVCYIDMNMRQRMEW